MSIKSAVILMRPDQPDSLVQSALDFCGDAHLEVLVIAQAAPPPTTPYDVVNSTTWMETNEAARKMAQERADEIEALLAKSGQSGGVTPHVAGHVHLADLAANAGRYADLVLMPQSGDPDRAMDHAVQTGALFESGTPMLLWAKDQTPTMTPGTVVLAWRATPECAHAVRAALPMLEKAKDVHAVLIDPVPSARGHGPEPGMNLAAYLAHHGVRVEVNAVPSEGRTVAHILEQEVKERAADLLVMGAYGHSRLRERLFGGTTQDMLSNPPCPILLAH
jgi:nucleotide-binding universal stress UspA family protein